MLMPHNPTMLGLRKTSLEKAHNFDTTKRSKNQSEDKKASERQKMLWDRENIAAAEETEPRLQTQATVPVRRLPVPPGAHFQILAP